jgi:hypothetical protein
MCTRLYEHSNLIFSENFMRHYTVPLHGRILIILFLLTITGMRAFAGVPDVIIETFPVHWSSDEMGNRFVDIYWRTGPDIQTIDGFYLYQQRNNGAFEKIDTIVGRNMAHIAVSIPTPGMYTFYLTAYNNEGEGQPSSRSTVDMTSDWIYYVEATIFDSVATGAEYQCTFTAEATNGATVHYRAEPAWFGSGNRLFPDIDSSTGELRVTPAEDGFYLFPVYAYLADDTTVFTQINLNLQAGDGVWEEPEVCSVIKGAIADKNSNPLADGFISVFNADATESSYAQFSTLVENGRYEVAVSEGSYYLVYSALNEKYEEFHFYPGTSDVNDAKLVRAACDDITTADFSVSLWADSASYIIVAGRVTRASDGSGEPAAVVFSAQNEWHYNPHVVFTDEEGFYEAELPVVLGPLKVAYIAMAMPADMNSELYHQYFDGTTNPARAVVIDESRTDVNFSLSATAAYDNSVSGTVQDSAGNPIDATVLIIPVSAVHEGTAYGMAETENGAYTLRDLPPDTYIIMAVPRAVTNFAAGYYIGNHRTVTMNWENADIVVVNESTLLDGIDMMLPSVGTSGINSITGVVTSAGDSRPLSGTLLYALNEHGAVAGYAMSGRNGEFQVAGLGAGQYHFSADKIGYRPSESSLSFDRQGMKHEFDVVLFARQTTGVVEQAAEVLVHTRPNPASSFVSVCFQAPSGRARLSLSDIAGVPQYRREVQTLDGENTIRLETGGLASGIYMLTIATENGVRTVPVTIVR